MFRTFIEADGRIIGIEFNDISFVKILGETNRQATVYLKGSDISHIIYEKSEPIMFRTLEKWVKSHV